VRVKEFQFDLTGTIDVAVGEAVLIETGFAKRNASLVAHRVHVGTAVGAVVVNDAHAAFEGETRNPNAGPPPAPQTTTTSEHDTAQSVDDARAASTYLRAKATLSRLSIHSVSAAGPLPTRRFSESS
jgi:hypothetical protein